MEIQLQEVIKLYKEELAAKTEECMLRKVIQAQLEEEIARLKKEIENMERSKTECMEN